VVSLRTMLLALVFSFSGLGLHLHFPSPLWRQRLSHVATELIPQTLGFAKTENPELGSLLCLDAICYI